MITALLLTAGFIGFVWAIKELTGRKSMDLGDIFWLGFGYAILIGTFWK